MEAPRPVAALRPEWSVEEPAELRDRACQKAQARQGVRPYRNSRQQQAEVSLLVLDRGHYMEEPDRA
jgi:hypothetical protein